MPESSPDRSIKPIAASRRGSTLSQGLEADGSYLCPACRHGHIQQMVLMDAFACNFCRHIFTANFTEQTLHIADSSQSMAWKWTGRRWQSVYPQAATLAPIVWVIGGVVVVMPSLLIWLSSYLFPPLPGSRWSWFPMLWAGMTLAFHLMLAGWLIAEYYQLPLYVSSKMKLRQAGEFLTRLHL
jgi:hypothetical protein